MGRLFCWTSGVKLVLKFSALNSHIAESQLIPLDLNCDVKSKTQLWLPDRKNDNEMNYRKKKKNNENITHTVRLFIIAQASELCH